FRRFSWRCPSSRSSKPSGPPGRAGPRHHLHGQFRAEQGRSGSDSRLHPDASMHDEHEERIRELLLIQRVAQRITSILDLDRLLEEILSDVCQTFGYRRLTMWLKDDATNELVLHGWSGTHYSEGDRFRIGVDGIVGHVGVTLKTYYAPNVLVDPFYRL